MGHLHKDTGNHATSSAEDFHTKNLALFHRDPEHNESFFLNGEAH